MADLKLTAARKSYGTIDVIQEMVTFLRNCPKGINVFRGRLEDAA